MKWPTQGHHLNKLGSTRAPDSAYQVSRSSAFWLRRRFFQVLPYMGMAAILVMWPGPFEQTFVPPSQGGSIWILASIGPVVSEKMFENVDIHTHIRTTEAYLYYKLTNEPKGSGELIKHGIVRVSNPKMILFWESDILNISPQRLTLKYVNCCCLWTNHLRKYAMSLMWNSVWLLSAIWLYPQPFLKMILRK